MYPHKMWFFHSWLGKDERNADAVSPDVLHAGGVRALFFEALNVFSDRLRWQPL